MKQFTRGAITVSEVYKDLFTVSIGTDLKDPETDIVVQILNTGYIDDMIAALKMYKSSLEHPHFSRNKPSGEALEENR